MMESIKTGAPHPGACNAGVGVKGNSYAYSKDFTQSDRIFKRQSNISPTHENIRTALSRISSDVDRETWVRVLAAIKSALGDDGRDIAEGWSQMGSSFNKADFSATWKSIRADGGITVATLWRLAIDSGWRPDGEPYQETEAERLERERRVRERTARDSQERGLREKEAATKTAELWKASGQLQDDHPYLDRKGIKPVPALREIQAERAAEVLEYAPKSDSEPLTGRLLVAPVKIDGKLTTAELIDESGRKSAISGGPKSGGYWAAQPLPEGDGAGITLTIGEGIATVLSAKEATGHPALAALSCGNLPKVAKVMRERYPAARLVILADLGHGQSKAEEAAKDSGAMLAIPRFTNEQIRTFQGQHGKIPTDFNDLIALAGLDAVRDQIHAALSEASEPGNSDSDLLADYIDVAALDQVTFSRTWVVEKLVEEGRVYEWFGKWKNGKTIAVIDLCAHASMGLTWGNRRTVPTLIIWVAGESCEDVQRRIAAWRLRHQVSAPMSFVIRTKPVHINVEDFAARLAREIETLKSKHPGLPVLLVVDTVARSLSPDCNENSIEGLGAFANNIIDTVVRPTGCAAICVHHSGHGDSDRSRGWSGFAAALDGSVKVEMERPAVGPATVTVSAVQMRSGAGDDALQFRVDVQEIPGADNFGNQLAEPVLFYLGEPAKEIKPNGKAQNEVATALRELSGDEPGRRVNYETLRKKCAGSGLARSSFFDGIKGLAKSGYLIHQGSEVWRPGGPSERPNCPSPKGLSDISDTDRPDSTRPKLPIRTNSDISDISINDAEDEIEVEV